MRMLIDVVTCLKKVELFDKKLERVIKKAG